MIEPIGTAWREIARMAPHAAPDAVAVLVLVSAVTVILVWRLSPVKVMSGGAIAGLARDRLCELPGVRAALCVTVWGR